jgi:hypothetical protein
MLADDLRHAMKTSGLSTYAIARLIGVDPKTVKGFADGGGLNIATASAICEVLGVGLAKQGELAQKEPPDYEEQILQTAAEMAFSLYQSVGGQRLDAIVAALREKRKREPE